MKKTDIDALCCPVCTGKMKLMPTRTRRNDILEGTLTCRECHTCYFIRNGNLYHVPEDVLRDRFRETSGDGSVLHGRDRDTGFNKRQD